MPYYAASRGESEKTQNIIQMLSNLKKEYAVFSTIDEINSRQAETLDTILVTAEGWDEVGDKKLLFEYVEEEGKNLIFTSLPEGTEAEKYNKAIGILEKGDIVPIEGIMLFEGMFIQNDMVYFEELEMDVQKVSIDARCKKLMVENAEAAVKQKELIPLIWEKRYGEGRFYVVNGDFFTMEKGMGILTGILCQIEEDFIYPVVNAKANLIDSFPELDNPYENQIKNMYNRNTYMFLRDIVWPAIVKLGESDTLVFSTRINQPVKEKNRKNYNYLADLLKKRGYEIDESLEEKELELPFVSAGHQRNSEEIVKMQGSISGWGIATHYLDISQVMGRNAGKPEYEWSSYSLELSKLSYDLYKDTEWMDAMTVSQALERYKRYLVLNPIITRGERQITVETENFHDLCFYIIRTEKTVLAGDGYEAKKIGENAYLIRVLQDKIVIGLEEETE